MVLVFRIVVALLLAIFCGAAIAANSAPAADPFILNITGIRGDPAQYQDTTGKTLATLQGVNPAVRNLVLISAGQSNNSNITPSAYTATNASAIDNLAICLGPLYKAVDPLMCTSNGPSPYTGNISLRVADALITAGKFDRVIIASAAIGGSDIAQWSTGILASRLPVTLRRLADLGIVPGTNVTFAIMIELGEQDGGEGTTQANYVAGFNILVANTAAAGFSGRWFVARNTLNNGSTSATIQAAQWLTTPSGVINNGTGIWKGADGDSLVGNICVGSVNCRQADNTHFSNAGAASWATDATYGWIQAMHASGAPF